jgi:AmmeMemoRadiSam system protein B
MFSKKIENLKIIPLIPAGLSYKDHYNFGKELKEVLVDSNKRIAVIASGDLSHALTTEAPAGYSEQGVEFDSKFQEAISGNNIDSLVNLDTGMVEKAHQCRLLPIATLTGVLIQINYKPELMSYEAPFGVGYLVANFKLD